MAKEHQVQVCAVTLLRQEVRVTVDLNNFQVFSVNIVFWHIQKPRKIELSWECLHYNFEQGSLADGTDFNPFIHLLSVYLASHLDFAGFAAPMNNSVLEVVQKTFNISVWQRTYALALLDQRLQSVPVSVTLQIFGIQQSSSSRSTIK